MENALTETVKSWLFENPEVAGHLTTMMYNACTELDFCIALREYVEMDNPLAHHASLYADLMAEAMSAIDWQAIARSFAATFWPDYRGWRQPTEPGTE